MIARWMKAGRAVCPWLVAVALAVAAAGPSACGNGSSDDARAEDASCDTRLYYYGPATCMDDEQCVREHGLGWFCSGYTYYPDGCGGTIRWGPMCQGVDAGAGPDAGVDADAVETEDVPEGDVSPD